MYSCRLYSEQMFAQLTRIIILRQALGEPQSSACEGTDTQTTAAGNM